MFMIGSYLWDQFWQRKDLHCFLICHYTFGYIWIYKTCVRYFFLLLKDRSRKSPIVRERYNICDQSDDPLEKIQNGGGREHACPTKDLGGLSTTALLWSKAPPPSYPPLNLSLRVTETSSNKEFEFIKRK